MAKIVTLDDIDFFDEDINEYFKELREAVENANNWSVTGQATLECGPGIGFAIHVKGNQRCETGVVQTGGITGRVSTSQLGEGNVRIRLRKGNSLIDGPIVKVYSSFRTAVPATTHCEIVPDGADWKLVGADCPL